MADLSKTVEIIFGAVDKNTKATIDSIGGSLSTFDAGVQKVAEPVTNFTEGLLKAEAGVAALAATFLTVSANESSRFGEKMEEIGSLINATPEKVAALGTSIQQFALNSTSDFDKINQAVYIATSNLGDTGKAMDILGVAEKGAVVGATDLEASTALLTRTMNAYGLVTGDSATNTANAERVMAAMFTTVQNGDINMTALSDNLGKVASSAAAAGIPIETVGAAIAAITGAGVNADQSMTLLNSLIKELLSPSDELSKALGGLKVTTAGLPAVMDALKISTGGSANKIYDLFSSSEAAKGALILANDSAGKFHTTLGAMKDGVANFNKNFDDFAGGMADSMQKMENAWTSMMITVGKPNQENFQAIYDAFANVLTAVDTAMRGGAFDFIFQNIDDFSDSLATSLESIARNLPEAFEGVDFAELVKSLNGLGDEFKNAFSDIFGNIDISTVEGLRSAIQTTVNIIAALVNTTTSILAQFDPIFASIGEAGKRIGGASGETELAVGKLLGAITILGEFGTVLGTALFALKESEASITMVFDAIMGGAKIFTNSLQVAFDTAALAIVGFLEGASFAFFKLTSALGLDDSAAKHKAAYESLRETSEAIKANLLSNAQDMQDGWDQMTRGISGSSEKASQSMSGLGVAAGKPGESIKGLSENSKTLADVFAAVGQRIDPLTGELLSLENASGRTNEEIQRLVDAANGLGSSAKDVAGGFSTLAEAEAAALKEMDAGKTTSITFADGLYQLHSIQSDTAKSSRELGDSAQNAANKAKEGSKEWKTVQEIMLATQKQTNDFTISMGELANKRYEIDVKAAVDLQTANIEAETARINAALSATADVIATLTTGTTDLWDFFGKKAGFVGGEEIKNAALNMERRLDEELAVKKQFTDAIVEKLRAETVRLTSGEPLISIDARELAPELELVFDKILKYTQVKATQQGLAMLVGI